MGGILSSEGQHPDEVRSSSLADKGKLEIVKRVSDSKFVGKVRGLFSLRPRNAIRQLAELPLEEHNSGESLHPEQLAQESAQTTPPREFSYNGKALFELPSAEVQKKLIAQDPRVEFFMCEEGKLQKAIDEYTMAHPERDISRMTSGALFSEILPKALLQRIQGENTSHRVDVRAALMSLGPTISYDGKHADDTILNVLDVLQAGDTRVGSESTLVTSISSESDSFNDQTYMRLGTGSLLDFYSEFRDEGSLFHNDVFVGLVVYTPGTLQYGDIQRNYAAAFPEGIDRSQLIQRIFILPRVILS